MMSAPSDDELRALLLHRLAPDRAAQLEERLVVEEGVAERVRELEYALLDGYARGSLGAEDRLAVSRWLLRTPADRHRLRVARALARFHLQQSQPQAGWLQRLLAAPGRPQRIALLAGAALAAVLAVFWPGRTRQAPNPPQAAAAAPAYTLALLSDTPRGAAPGYRVPAGTASLRLQAEVAEPAGDGVYELRLLDAGGRSLAAYPGLRLHQAGRHRYVEAVLGGGLLQAGTLRVELHAPADGAAPAASWQVEIAGR